MYAAYVHWQSFLCSSYRQLLELFCLKLGAQTTTTDAWLVYVLGYKCVFLEWVQIMGWLISIWYIFIFILSYAARRDTSPDLYHSFFSFGLVLITTMRWGREGKGRKGDDEHPCGFFSHVTNDVNLKMSY